MTTRYYAILLRSIVGDSVLKRTEKCLQNLVRETLVDSKNCIFKNHWSPWLRFGHHLFFGGFFCCYCFKTFLVIYQPTFFCFMLYSVDIHPEKKSNWVWVMCGLIPVFAKEAAWAETNLEKFKNVKKITNMSPVCIIQIRQKSEHNGQLSNSIT